MKNCTHCVFADWDRTQGGKLHPSGAGRCTFKYVPRPLPASMYRIGSDSICGGFINRRKDLNDHCVYYARSDRQDVSIQLTKGE